MEIFGIAGRLGFNRVGKPHRESRFLYPSQPSHTTLLVTNLPDEPKHSRISKSRISPERNVNRPGFYRDPRVVFSAKAFA